MPTHRSRDHTRTPGTPRRDAYEWRDLDPKAPLRHQQETRKKRIRREYLESCEVLGIEPQPETP